VPTRFRRASQLRLGPLVLSDPVLLEMSLAKIVGSFHDDVIGIVGECVTTVTGFSWFSGLAFQARRGSVVGKAAQTGCWEQLLLAVLGPAPLSAAHLSMYAIPVCCFRFQARRGSVVGKAAAQKGRLVSCVSNAFGCPLSMCVMP
jgi:hypothetical protein